MNTIKFWFCNLFSTTLATMISMNFSKIFSPSMASPAFLPTVKPYAPLILKPYAPLILTCTGKIPVLARNWKISAGMKEPVYGENPSQPPPPPPPTTIPNIIRLIFAPFISIPAVVLLVTVALCLRNANAKQCYDNTSWILDLLEKMGKVMKLMLQTKEILKSLTKGW